MEKLISFCKKRKYLLVSLFFILSFLIVTLIFTFLKSFKESPFFFQDTYDWFMDFFNLNYWSCSSYKIEGNNNPSFATLLASFFCLIGGGKNKYLELGSFGIRSTPLGIFSLIIFFLIPVIICIFILFKHLKKDKLLWFTIICLFSNFFIFEINRANYVIYSFLFVVLFLDFYYSDNKIKINFSYLFLALAGSIKFYPLIFGLVIISKKDWMGVLKCAGLFVLIFFLSFAFLPGNFSNIQPCFTNMFNYFFKNTYPCDYCIFDTSLKSFFSIIGFLYTQNPISTIYYNSGLNIFTIIIYVLIILLNIIICLYTKEKWIITLLSSLSICLIPSPSFYYVNIFMFIPFFYLITHDGYKHINIKIPKLFLLIIFCPIFYGTFINNTMSGLRRFDIYIQQFLIQILYVILLTYIYINEFIIFYKRKSIKDSQTNQN